MQKDTSNIPAELQGQFEDHLVAKKTCVAWAASVGFDLHVHRSNIVGDKRKMELVCRHYSEPRDQTEKKKSNGQTSVIVDHNGNSTESNKKQTRNKDSQRFGCPFIMKLRPLSKDSQQWHVVLAPF
ncbi:hypothetical protein BJV82DRAFT_673413 [Fennellomyces sp. T-0311]|nr:hypothetical protein BJV82DRAFT_673413 [Fennellomyces sp. T-0311]